MNEEAKALFDSLRFCPVCGKLLQEVAAPRRAKTCENGDGLITVTDDQTGIPAGLFEPYD